jgi:hypothetical protein
VRRIKKERRKVSWRLEIRMEENSKKTKIFEGRKVRTHWDDEKEKWFFSIVDVVAILTESVDPRKYWNKLIQRLRDEGSEVVTFCHQLKLVAEDGKLRETDVGDTEQILRLIQSIPSKKAEPFKLWLAKVGNERIFCYDIINLENKMLDNLVGGFKVW